MTSRAVYCIPLFWAWFLVVVAANILPSSDGFDVMLLFIVVQSPDNHWTCHLSQSTNFCPWWQNPIFLWSQMAAFLEDCSADLWLWLELELYLFFSLWQHLAWWGLNQVIRRIIKLQIKNDIVSISSVALWLHCIVERQENLYMNQDN